MLKWEYLTVFVANTGKDGEYHVTRENWKPLFKKGVLLPNFKDTPAWTDYLTEKGEEGWELVGFSANRQENSTTIHAVFKRPKDA